MLLGFPVVLPGFPSNYRTTTHSSVFPKAGTPVNVTWFLQWFYLGSPLNIELLHTAVFFPRLVLSYPRPGGQFTAIAFTGPLVTSQIKTFSAHKWFEFIWPLCCSLEPMKFTSTMTSEYFIRFLAHVSNNAAFSGIKFMLIVFFLMCSVWVFERHQLTIQPIR